MSRRFLERLVVCLMWVPTLFRLIPKFSSFSDDSRKWDSFPRIGFPHFTDCGKLFQGAFRGYVENFKQYHPAFYKFSTFYSTIVESQESFLKSCLKTVGNASKNEETPAGCFVEKGKFHVFKLEKAWKSVAVLKNGKKQKH